MRDLESMGSGAATHRRVLGCGLACLVLAEDGPHSCKRGALLSPLRRFFMIAQLNGMADSKFATGKACSGRGTRQ
eukprot:1980909-Pyramimonas_sp.AAC.1